MAESIISSYQFERTFLVSAQVSDASWSSVTVSLDAYKFILLTISNISGRIYLSQLVTKDLFISLNSPAKCFAPEVYVGGNRCISDFYYSNGAIYYKHISGDLISTVYGIK